MILRFPSACVRHGRASASPESLQVPRAASPVKISAVSPAAAAAGVDKSDSHHSAGILSRCHHLLTCDALAPTSEAHASLVAHSSMIERNVAAVDMESSLGQFVLKRKANVYYDCGKELGHNGDMAKAPTKSAHKREFIDRVRRAREARYPTQGPILTILGLDQGTYKQYETRSYLPHDLIDKFCKACGIDMAWLFTGIGVGPAAQATPKRSKTRPFKRQRKAA